jgi:large subunit ribosomal protein L19
MITSENLQERDVTFKPGDTVRVHYRVIEGNRERIQVFEGLVIARKGGGVNETFTVRKNSFGVAVERIFPLHSPKIAKREVVSRRGASRQALLHQGQGRPQGEGQEGQEVEKGVGRDPLE